MLVLSLSTRNNFISIVPVAWLDDSLNRPKNRAGKPAHLLVVLVSFRLVFLATFKIYYVDFWLWNYLDFWTLNYVVFGTSKFCPFIWVYRYSIYFWITRTLIFHHVVPNLHFVTYFWYCHCHLLMLINYWNWNKLFHTRLCWKFHSGHSFRSWK